MEFSWTFRKIIFILFCWRKQEKATCIFAEQNPKEYYQILIIWRLS